MELGHKDNPESPIEEGDIKWQVADENNDIRTKLLSVKRDWGRHEKSIKWLTMIIPLVKNKQIFLIKYKNYYFKLK